jgi:hypothetical protein
MSRLVEMKVYLDPDLARTVNQKALHARCSRSEFVRATLASVTSADGPDQLEAALGRRLDRQSRQIERLERDVAISAEAVAMFARLWLKATPDVPEGARLAAEAQGRRRYLAFLEAIGRRVADGSSLRKEVLEDRSPVGPA